MNYSAEIRQPGFIARDHRYVYLGGSLLALVGLSLWYSAPTPYSFLAADGAAGQALAAVCYGFIAVSLIALLVKWTHWKTYGATVMKRPAVVRVSRYFSYLLAIACGLFAVDRVVLKLDPGMAFGTGAHHTTRMCLELLEKTVRPGDTMLDMGCGSGILSIASLLLGAKKAVAVDIDPIAETIARENAAINGLGEQDYEIRIGNLISDEALQTDIRGQYPVVAANIVADVILALCPFAREVVAPGGAFIVSGIIDDREAEVEAGLKQAGFAVKEVLSSDCWFAILCENPQ